MSCPDHEHAAMPEQTQHTIQLKHENEHEQPPDGQDTTTPKPPPKPDPSSDPQLFAADDTSTNSSEIPSTPVDPEHDIFKLAPLDALKLLSASIERLVRLTGDVPPTPPPRTAMDPQMSGMLAEKSHMARSYSDKELSTRRQLAERQRERDQTQQRKRDHEGEAKKSSPPPPSADSRGMDKFQAYSAAMTARLTAQRNTVSHSAPAISPSSSSAAAAQPIDGVLLKPVSPDASRSSTATFQPPEPYMVIGADAQPINQQHGAITRKFYSKNEPPIPIAQYLLRLHQFCPMSTGVYLATSLYIHRLAVDERAIPVTRRNAHRLVLAGLRVAMKALEDLSYPHGKMARVGGVSEVELARLEISFCFLAGFELVVGEEALRNHWEALRTGRAVPGGEVPTLTLGRRPRGEGAGGG